MSRLSDVIHQVVEESLDTFGQVHVNTAVSHARPMLDDEDCELLISEALGKRIGDAAKNGSKAATVTAMDRQISFPFPELRTGYAIDVDGRFVKLTTELTQLEFRRIIEIRTKQIEADMVQKKLLEQAYLAVAPIWKARPELTFGEVCRIYSGEEVGAA